MRNFRFDPSDLDRKLEQAARLLGGELDCEVATTPAREVFREDNMRLMHYRPTTESERLHATPVLITYALINRHIMLDLEPGRSFIQGLLDRGLDVYLIDWGYPNGADRYLDLDDYINHYLDRAVEWIRTATRSLRINLMGICMGGTFSVIYSALHPGKIKNLITFATPFDCDIKDGILFLWAKKLDVDLAVDTLGNIPGDLMNVLYLLAVPVATMDKYIRFAQRLDEPRFVQTFLRMEKWIYDSPDMAGEMFRQYIRDIFQANLLFKNRLQVGGRHVDLNRITCPVLNIFGKKDYLVPPSSPRPLCEAVGSTDTTTLDLDLGHIGMFVGRNSQKTVCPAVAEWIRAR